MNVLNWRGYRWATWVGIAVVLIGDITVAVQGKWDGVILLTASAVLLMVFLFVEDRLPALVVFLLVLATVANAISYVWNLYGSVWFFDEAMHLYTALAVTIPLGLLMSSAFKMDEGWQRLLFVLSVACVAVTLGVIWEIVEWVYDMATPQGNIIRGKTDTIVDLIVDGIGAMVGAYLALKIKMSSHSSAIP